jgi:hypothetical protein
MVSSLDGGKSLCYNQIIALIHHASNTGYLIISGDEGKNRDAVECLPPGQIRVDGGDETVSGSRRERRTQEVYAYDR